MTTETGVGNLSLELLRRQNEQLGREAERLKGGGGGTTSPPMPPSVDLKDYVDKADEALESRLMGKLDSLATKESVRNNVWGAVAAILGVILALLAFAGDRFDAGLSLSEQAAAQVELDKRQDQSMREINQKLDQVIQRLPAQK